MPSRRTKLSLHALLSDHYHTILTAVSQELQKEFGSKAGLTETRLFAHPKNSIAMLEVKGYTRSDLEFKWTITLMFIDRERGVTQVDHSLQIPDRRPVYEKTTIQMNKSALKETLDSVKAVSAQLGW